MLPVEPIIFSPHSLKYGLPFIEAHIHTSFSHGSASVSRIVEHAIKTGLEYIAFTEHTEPHYHKNDPDWFSTYWAEIEHNRQRWKNRIGILAGIEAPVIDFKGNLDVADAILQKVDYILGTVHRYPGLDKHQRVTDLDPHVCNALEYRSLSGLAENPAIDAIAHIGGTCGKYGQKLSEEQIRKIIIKAKKNNIAVEINSAYHRPLKPIFRICREEDALITIGSDCHRLEDVGTCRQLLNKIICV